MQYSSCGLTTDLYNLSIVSLGPSIKYVMLEGGGVREGVTGGGVQEHVTSHLKKCMHMKPKIESDV